MSGIVRNDILQYEVKNDTEPQAAQYARLIFGFMSQDWPNFRHVTSAHETQEMIFDVNNADKHLFLCYGEKHHLLGALIRKHILFETLINI